MANQSITYETYKMCTDVFTSWICQTGSDHGCATKTSRPLDPTQARPGKKPPNKSKAHKKWMADKAKATAAATAANTTADGRDIYLVTSEEILKQAKFLSELDQTILMPQPVWQAFKKALAGRKQYARKYANEALGENEEADGHVAFIRVLEQAAEYTKRVASVQVAASASATAAEKTEVPLSNLFESLELTPEDNFGGQQAEELDPTSAAKPEEYKPKKVFRVQIDPKSDLRFKQHCFLEQGRQLFAYIIGIWDEYNAGKIHLAHAAFLTESMLELIGEQEQKLAELLSAHEMPLLLDLEDIPKDPIDIASMSLRDIRAARQVQPGYTFALAPLSQRHSAVSNPVRERSDTFLVQFMMDLGLETILRNQTWENPKAIVAEKLELPLLPSSRDRTSSILQSVNEGGPVTFQAAFAAALLQDLAARKSTALNSPFAALDKTSAGMDDREHLVLESGTQLFTEVREVSERLRTLQNWLGRWPFRDFRASRSQERAVLSRSTCIQPSANPDLLRLSNPVACGTTQLTLYTMYSRLGIDVLNTSPHVFAMSYIRLGLILAGRLTGTWPTLEWVSAHYSKDIFIGGEQPTSFEAALVRMQLAAGGSLTRLSALKRNRPSDRKAALDATVGKSDRKWDIKSSKVIQILRGFVYNQETLLRSLYSLDAEMKKEASGWPSPLENGTVPFLEELKKVLKTAFEELNKDYLTIDTTCRVLFRQIEARLDWANDVEEHASNSWKTHTVRSYVIAWEVLKDLQHAEIFRKSHPSTSNNGMPTPLADAAQDVLGRYITAGARGIPTFSAE